MDKANQNLTLTIDEELLLAARKIALDRGTSVNQMVREHLAAVVEDTGARRVARARLKRAFKRGIVEVGERTWTRADLYER